MKHLFIINPVAGGKKGDAGKTRSDIEQILANLDISYEIYITKAPMDATAKIIKEAETDNNLFVYACGGDGTLNECVNGAVNRENVTVTHYPCGTGNDFIKTFGKENVDKFKDLRSLISGYTKKLDIIDCNGRYGINICSAGIDARVGNDVHKYSSIPIIGGATGYVVSLLVNVIKGVKQNFRMKSENFEREDKITLICACNGRFYGGGFNPVPDAVPDDGIIDFLIVDGVSRLKVAAIVGNYSKGKYKEMGSVVTYFQDNEMSIEGDEEFVVNIDGEIIHATKVFLKLIPKGINFLFPAGLEQ